MSSRGRSSRSSGPRSPGTPSSTPTSPTSTPGWKSGGTGTKPCVTPGASTRATRTATASARSTSTRWRASGPCCAPGSGPIVASRRRSCRSTSPSSSSCTTPGAGVGPSSVNSSPPWWREVPTTPDPDKSVEAFEPQAQRLDPHQPALADLDRRQLAAADPLVEEGPAYTGRGGRLLDADRLGRGLGTIGRHGSYLLIQDEPPTIAADRSCRPIMDDEG